GVGHLDFCHGESGLFGIARETGVICHRAIAPPGGARKPRGYAVSAHLFGFIFRHREVCSLPLKGGGLGWGQLVTRTQRESQSKSDPLPARFEARERFLARRPLPFRGR